MARNTYFQDEQIEKKWNPKQLKKIGAYVIKYKLELILGLILMGVASVCSLGGPYISKIIMDDMIPNQNIRGVVVAVLVYVGLIIAQAVFTIIKGFLMNKMGYWVIYDLRKDLFSHLQSLSFRYFDDRPTGKILVRITNYINALASLLSDGIVNLITDFVVLIAIVVIMLSIDVRLTLISILTCIPLFGVVFGFKNKIHYWQVQTNHKGANRTAFVHENIMGVKIIQSFTHEKQ
ncbi:MAG: ABC transporter ATP-binding protein, partial [Ruminococcaceae bacterium]|nr:ABC transporter ATP-binding protein [Oscillospiraceae bacterium]